MLQRKKLKVILDTNLFISFLIGKRLKGLKDAIVHANITLIFSEQNIHELEAVTRREKFQKYFPQKDVVDLISFIRIVGEIYTIDHFDEICRDPKDDFLLALAKKSKADFLVSGDNDLLELKRHLKTKIITVETFVKLLD